MNNQQQILSRFLLAPTTNYDTSHNVRVRQYVSKTDTFKQAAVLIPLVPRNDSFNILLTRRAKHLKHHPGQVAFPGGRHEAYDVDLIATAIRETKEETGILCKRSHILGQLPSLPTISGYMVTPFLSTIAPDYTPQLDPNEVDELFEVPIHYLLNPVNMRTQQFRVEGKIHTIYSIPFSNYSIWGATAQMIKLLSKQLWY
ncbi:CoA pyrophosphatase [Photobacterium lipolyticum]|uniref:CoA pyrophosphatase n=1 Tax=Photobacterium lipolyticum TaxID=266810 RepID=A0A2T3N4D2_9GAMM|nr:CoA pyrophosphatase [Photobacterium lipolyticum]PSW07302.1 CoA pyrophosphatase [Photobacterium lipolyticum]